ncbi:MULTISPECIES: hypothetical protein [Halobacterium]|uniref:Uncharacterized protein n=4 Tax=Halobacterium salinarum TaxID=2242 RepID=Q9HQ60_HALSA|nr:MULTISPECIES: hypothetical protein [Halobacterium]AAG19657.1 hypothetical protein VNG_1314H [Halobacterium salinarum NRC-1]MBB6090347.1 hypothetical protein [Halobacterium salinarum]MCF2165165.1 hypothetical protein [Halobacterium salinarum]MCF2168026.1 hypothetical protein [Halobacterium salinarum]MCF2207050.1 hypothetical protein [Halobacterium salinarum]
MSETDSASETVEEPTTWPDLAVGLYDRLTGRGAEIIYEFDELDVDVPSGTGDDAEHARWHVDGTIRVTTRERD